MFGSDPKVKSLEEVPLLRTCSSSELRTIASSGDLVTVEEGDVIHYGRTDPSVVLILEGHAALNGTKEIGSGDCHGVIGLLTGAAETDELRMLTEGRVLVFGRREFNALMLRAPGFALGVAKELAGRVRSAVARERREGDRSRGTADVVTGALSVTRRLI